LIRSIIHSLGPVLPSFAAQQVGSCLGYTGRGANAFGKAARDPNVWSGRALQEVFIDLESAVLHQCIRSLIGALAPDHHGYQRACDLISGQASNRAIRVTSVRVRREDRSPFRLILSQTSAGKAVGYLINSSSSCLRCSFVRAWRPFLRPDLRATDAPRAGAVKAGRRSGLASRVHAARPRLDGPEHGARITLNGRPSHRS